MMENNDTSQGSALLVPAVNEDSVDIYDGLDIGLSRNAVESPRNLSQLKESMDLYEELVTEEQQSRESSYTELKSRYQAAQNQIKELRRRLEQMEMQNTRLNTENYRLKKNICALLQTARQEVTRKDAEIQRLNQRSRKTHHHLPHVNNVLDQSSSSHTTTANSKNKPPPPLQPSPPNPQPLPPPPSAPPPPPPPPSPSIPPPPPPPSSPPPPPPPSLLPPLAASSPRKDHPTKDHFQPARKDRDSSTKQANNSCTEARTSKASSHSHSKRMSQVADKHTEPSLSKSSTFSPRRHSESDKHKSKHREEKYHGQRLPESTDRRHRTGSDPSRDCHGLEKNSSHKAEKDAGRRHDSRSCRSRNYQHAEGHHRSEKARSPLPELLHVAGSSDDSKERGRERRQDKSRIGHLDSEHSTSHSSTESHSRHHRKLKTGDGHRRNSDSKDRRKSSSDQRTERYSDTSKEREVGRLSMDYQRKEKRRHEDEFNLKHKRNRVSEQIKDGEKQLSEESQYVKSDVHNKETEGKTHKTLQRSSEELNAEKIPVEDNSPNRKLCFMETLNLTLSPNKKPLLLIDAAHEVLHNGPNDNSLLPDIEDMCVIDEVDSSDLKSGLEDCEEQFTVSLKKTDPEKTHAKTGDKKEVQEEDKSLGENATDRQAKDNSVQTTSLLSQPQDAAENEKDAHLAPKAPESSSLKVSDSDIKNNQKDKTKPIPDIQVATSCPSGTTGKTSEQRTSNFLQRADTGSGTDQTVAATERVGNDSHGEHSVPRSVPLDSVPEYAAALHEGETCVPEDATAKTKLGSRQASSAILPQSCLQGLSPPASSSSTTEKVACTQNGVKDSDAVSSTINLESLPQEGLSLPEAIDVLTRTNDEDDNSSNIATDPSSSTGCIGVSKVSSTTGEMALPEKYTHLPFTPKKNLSPAKSHESNVEPSSSKPLLHDEDSMMRTLSNLKRIPDAISPLRSPIQITKRGLLHVHGKAGHVKSLQKEFSSTAADCNSKKLDVNKENKYPGSPVKHDTQDLVDKLSDRPSSLSDTELEDGEILSESDEPAAISPVSATKRGKSARPVRNKPIPDAVLKRKSEERCAVSNEMTEAAGGSSLSPSSKSRFKTVCPASTKASFSTVEQVMETFKLVRAEIRKKYMKLHKTFPKKSFYGVMENFRESFLEFVDGAHFGQISNEGKELKSKLKKLIMSVFGKVADNGIVKRIFEQQAVDLKQKLWDFVDVQVDYLFKDIHTTLKSLCRPANSQPEDKRPCRSQTVSGQPPAKKTQPQQKDPQSSPNSQNRIKPCAVAPYKTGLGSRGKDIRMAHVERDKNVAPHSPNFPNTQSVVDFLSPKKPPSPDKNNIASLVVSHNGSLLDKTDFELLTEQQASSLTFNLVRDSQMGEIFKCLLQGSDLLETSGMTGDNTAWSLGTPRKDGERLLSITTPTKFDSPSKLLSPTKFDTPSKLIATWSSISPRKMSSPRSKHQVQLNPALFDESCLLEVPSGSRALSSQRTYSILAEDLAVSLTIPSPLKSDSHLSFLQPSIMHNVTTPDSVISAHISEDALLDGEDATEQDIHLALDTDNSSRGSSSSVASQAAATPFVFKPDLPMQALVMEKSNDHFIVKIRQSTKETNVTLTADESLSQTLTEEHQHGEEDMASQTDLVLLDRLQKDATSNENSVCDPPECSGMQKAASVEDKNFMLTTEPLHKNKYTSSQQITSNHFSEESQKRLESLRAPAKITPSKNGLCHAAQNPDHLLGQIGQEATDRAVTLTIDTSQAHHDEGGTSTPSKSLLSEVPKMTSPCSVSGSSRTDRNSQASPPHVSDSPRDQMVVSESERSPSTAEDAFSTPEKDHRVSKKGRKRKRHQEKSKVKRSRKEDEDHKEEMVSDAKKDDEESQSLPSPLSPNSLSAMNVVKKKGMVVIAWTRDEDRAILIDLKKRGASRETFSALSEKLNKPSGQIAQRFYQLMKLFKKQGKMET